MSWVENIKSAMIIQTGDGKVYKPQWLNAGKSKDYNISTFEFPNISGTLADRRLPKGRKYPLQLFFQGENHLETAQSFEKSADDPRPWTVTHPLYGRIIVQPTSLEFDNSKYNVSEIRCEVIETITQEYPATSVVQKDKIENSVEDCNDLMVNASLEKINAVGIKPISTNKITAFINKTDAKVNKLITDNTTAQEYFNKLNNAKSAINSIASKPQDAIAQTIDLLKTTATLPISVKSKTDAYISMITDAETTIIGGIIEITDKSLYMSQVGSVMTALCLSASNPLKTDYPNRNDVLSTIDVLLAANTTYLNTLDSLQTDTGGTPSSFIPDAASLISLNNLLNYTVSNLFSIALSAKQERSVILENDSNWIILAHRFYGLKADDSTIEELIRNNNAGLSEMLQVRKNRKITYYV